MALDARPRPRCGAKTLYPTLTSPDSSHGRQESWSTQPTTSPATVMHAIGSGSSSPGPRKRSHSSSRPAISAGRSAGMNGRTTTTPSVTDRPNPMTPKSCHCWRAAHQGFLA